MIFSFTLCVYWDLQCDFPKVSLHLQTFFNVAAVNSVHADNFTDVGHKLSATAALKCLCFHLWLSQNLCGLWHITHLFLDKSISLFRILQRSFEILFHLWKMAVLLQYCRSSPPEQICSSSVAAQSKILLFFMHFGIRYSTTVIKMVRNFDIHDFIFWKLSLIKIHH